MWGFIGDRMNQLWLCFFNSISEYRNLVVQPRSLFYFFLLLPSIIKAQKNENKEDRNRGTKQVERTKRNTKMLIVHWINFKKNKCKVLKDSS